MDDGRVVELVAASLVREYLHGKGCHNTLSSFDEEIVRTADEISSRSILAKTLHIEKLLKKNKQDRRPYKTILEVISKYFITHGKWTTKKEVVRDDSLRNRQCLQTLNEINSDSAKVVDILGEVTSDLTELVESVETGNSVIAGVLRNDVKIHSHNLSNTCSASDTFLVTATTNLNEDTCQPVPSNDVNCTVDNDIESVSCAVGSDISKSVLDNLHQTLVSKSLTHMIDSDVSRNLKTGYSRMVTIHNVVETTGSLKDSTLLVKPAECEEGNSMDRGGDDGARNLHPTRLKTSRKSLTGHVNPGGLQYNNKNTTKPRRLAFLSKANVDYVLDSTSTCRKPGKVCDEPIKQPDLISSKVQEEDELVMTVEASSEVLRGHCQCPDDSEAMGNKQVANKVQKTSTNASSAKEEEESQNNILSDKYANIRVNDLDELEDSYSGSMVSPVPISHVWLTLPQGNPLDLSTAMALKTLLLGNYKRDFPEEWKMQNFGFNGNFSLSYGLIQKKGGPCGVLACIQAYLLKELLFSKGRSLSKKSNDEFSEEEVNKCFSQAFAQILWKVGNHRMATVAFPSSRQAMVKTQPGVCDGFVEKIDVLNFTDLPALQSFLSRHVGWFTGENRYACIAFLYSAILSRGIESVRMDMDDPKTAMIGMHGYCSQEVINLLLTGHASSNVFDNIVLLEEGTQSQSTLRGVARRSDFGFLALFEHYNSCQVGNNLKCPRYPIWVVCSESHFSVLFAKDLVVFGKSVDQEPTKFDLYYYDGLLHQDREIRLTIDLSGEQTPTKYYKEMVPPLELCIRTKWKGATVNWNGMEPLL